ncbi:hypothetical protein ACOBQX_05345 [Actinokineospora sp. G85]|uniref:hypothetical protein n=1 Tax=Actinokineospora sp. G85 TaxID=3406626 RepID=UPI003C7534FD
MRLWPTLARFDLAYNPVAGISSRTLADFPHLWGYARDLHHHPAFHDTTDFSTFRLPPPEPRHDGITRLHVDQVEPDWTTPHDRDRLTP